MFPSLTPDPRLLAIEDDPTLGAHLFQHLNGSGFEVTWCRDGEEGLAAARSGGYDLILMDIMLPGRDGLEILRQLRQEQALPVILMSALGAEQDRIAGFSQGADDYLPKPFSLAELRVRIDAILRRIALERGGRAGPLRRTAGAALAAILCRCLRCQPWRAVRRPDADRNTACWKPSSPRKARP